MHADPLAIQVGMPFVKLDCGILNSTLWVDKDAREVFITALLMAEPAELADSQPQIQVRSFDETGFVVPPGWYGFVKAAGVGIVARAGLEREAGISALERLGEPEYDSRSPDHEGRRLVRVEGGYVVLNYMKYRDFDYTAAERMRRYRERRKGNGVTRNSDDVTRNSDDILSRCDDSLRIAEAEAEADKREDRSSTDDRFPEFWAIYPRKIGKQKAAEAWRRKKLDAKADEIIDHLRKRVGEDTQWREGAQYIPHPTTWLNRGGWEDEYEAVPPDDDPMDGAI